MVPGGTYALITVGIIGPGAGGFIEGFRADYYLITSIGAMNMTAPYWNLMSMKR